MWLHHAILNLLIQSLKYSLGHQHSGPVSLLRAKVTLLWLLWVAWLPPSDAVHHFMHFSLFFFLSLPLRCLSAYPQNRSAWEREREREMERQADWSCRITTNLNHHTIMFPKQHDENKIIKTHVAVKTVIRTPGMDIFSNTRCSGHVKSACFFPFRWITHHFITFDKTACPYQCHPVDHKISAFIQSRSVSSPLTWCPRTDSTEQPTTKWIHF